MMVVSCEQLLVATYDLRNYNTASSLNDRNLCLPLRHSSLLLFIADALHVGEAGKQTSAIIERSRRVSTSTVSVNGDEKGWGSEWHNYVLRIIICLVGFSVNGGLYVVIGDVLHSKDIILTQYFSFSFLYTPNKHQLFALFHTLCIILKLKQREYGQSSTTGSTSKWC